MAPKRPSPAAQLHALRVRISHLKLEKRKLRKELEKEIRWRNVRIQKIKTQIKRAIKILDNAVAVDDLVVDRRARSIQQQLDQMATTSDSD